MAIAVRPEQENAQMPHKDAETPLILAVEGDSHQAAELSAMFHKEFGAELVLATSAQHALTAIGDRIPDLVLTSAFLPPKDEATLFAWLRNMGDAAAHVQTVTIPVLAASKTPPTGRSSTVFSLVKERPIISAPDGCDPAVFADWVAMYLDLASGERHAGSGSRGRGSVS